ncbi:MAG: manganese efflux pump [Syntrophomonas sp.]
MYEQIITVSIVALVLGMDAFSLALGMGLKGVSRSYERKFSATVAVLHVLMPLLGLKLGLVAGNFLGIWATRLGALVLAWLGTDMCIKAYRDKKTTVFKFSQGREKFGIVDKNYSEKWAAIAVLAISVSIDALTAGFSLGTLKMPILFTVILTGMVAGSMTLLGFAGGKISGRLLGTYAQILGGVVLIGLAIKFLI